jgi:hypothetical protein
VDALTVSEDVAAVLPTSLRQDVIEDLVACTRVLVMLRDSVGTAQKSVAAAAATTDEEVGAPIDADAVRPPRRPPRRPPGRRLNPRARQAVEGGDAPAADAEAAAKDGPDLLKVFQEQVMGGGDSPPRRPPAPHAPSHRVALTLRPEPPRAGLAAVFEKVADVIDKVKDRFAGVDTTISSSRSQAGAVRIATPPWKSLATAVRANLSRSGDLEVELNETAAALEGALSDVRARGARPPRPRSTAAGPPPAHRQPAAGLPRRALTAPAAPQTRTSRRRRSGSSRCSASCRRTSRRWRRSGRRQTRRRKSAPTLGMRAAAVRAAQSRPST